MPGKNKRRDKLALEAQRALTPGEQVLDATTGLIPVRLMGNDSIKRGIVLVTNRRVILYSKKLGGYDVQDFAFGLLASVDHKKGLTQGELDFAAAGDHSRIKQVPKEDVERISQLIRHQMAQAHAHAQPAPAPTASTLESDPATGIRNLAALRDDGLITEAEFEMKKKQLLGL